MLLIFKPIRKTLSNAFKIQEVRTDNVVFRLHCILTVAFLVSASLMLTATQLVGKPIACITTPSAEQNKDWAKAIETFCWIHSTFNMPDGEKREERNFNANPLLDYLTASANALENGKTSKLEAPKSLSKNKEYDYLPHLGGSVEHKGPKKYYTYYQWVCFVLFLQGIICYLPKLLWDRFEGGLLLKLTAGLHDGVCSSEEREKRTDSVAGYFLKYKTSHKWYPLVYWLCEGLCLVNLVLQMWLMDAFLGGNFFSYGTKVTEYLRNLDVPQFEREDPLIYVFPRVTKCTFYKYGPSGSIVNLDNLCILPQNVINEKVYVLLWFWYIVLACLFFLVLCYRIFLVVLPRFRPRLLAVRSRRVKATDAGALVSTLDLGSWWLLYVLAKNMDPLAYRDLISTILKREKKNYLLK